ncbi:hypothetical protein AMTRI_Chr06g171330 [Amborella trichopoda]
MAKGKDARVRVLLECTNCTQNGITEKNRHNTHSRLELKKFSPSCLKHMIHAEIKK